MAKMSKASTKNPFAKGSGSARKGNKAAGFANPHAKGSGSARKDHKGKTLSATAAGHPRGAGC